MKVMFLEWNLYQQNYMQMKILVSNSNDLFLDRHTESLQKNQLVKFHLNILKIKKKFDHFSSSDANEMLKVDGEKYHVPGASILCK